MFDMVHAEHLKQIALQSLEERAFPTASFDQAQAVQYARIAQRHAQLVGPVGEQMQVPGPDFRVREKIADAACVGIVRTFRNYRLVFERRGDLRDDPAALRIDDPDLYLPAQLVEVHFDAVREIPGQQNVLRILSERCAADRQGSESYKRAERAAPVHVRRPEAEASPALSSLAPVIDEFVESLFIAYRRCA